MPLFVMTQAKEIKAGEYVRINNEVLKVVRKELAAYGTHCHTKIKLYLQGLFSKGEKTLNFGHNDNIETLDIKRKDGQVISKLNDKVQVMDAVSYETFDANVDKELLEQLNEGDTVRFIDLQGKVIVLEKARP